MVFGIITAVAACPAIVGTTEAIRYGQKQNQREQHRGRKCHLKATLLKPSIYTEQFSNAHVVLKDGKLYVDTRSDPGLNDLEEYFPATVLYYAYASRQQAWKDAGYASGEGLVTVINKEKYLNWVYIDRSTFEVRYGVKKDADPNIVGPWDYTKVDRRLTFQGWEGFIAVQEEDDEDMWALYFDCKDDGLQGPGQVGHDGKRMLEVEVWRTEIRRDLESAISERQERLQLRKES